MGCGIVGLLTIAVQTTLFRYRLRSASTLTAGPTVVALDQVCRRAGVRRRVRLVESNTVREPAAFGVWRWTVALPERLDTRLPPEELTALLAHELAHLVRGDVVWLWIGRVLSTCFAFQPLNRLACRRWRQAAELLCDDWAIGQSVSPFALARCLTQIAEWSLSGRVCPASLAATGAGSSLTRRVERLLDGSHRDNRWGRTWRRHIVTLAVVVTSLGLCLWAPRAVRTTQSFGGEPNIALDLRSPTDAPTSTDSEAAEWHKLQSEWSALQTDLIRMTELLASASESPEVHAAVETIRQRIQTIEKRLQESVRQQSAERDIDESEP